MGTPTACTRCPCDAPAGLDISVDEEAEGPQYVVIAPGTVYDSRIATGGARQSFIFEAMPGYTYYTQAWLTTLGDSVMYMYEARQVAGGYEPGRQVAYNDDRPDAPNYQQYYGSAFSYQVPYSGAPTGHYIIEVRAYSASETGGFQILTEPNTF